MPEGRYIFRDLSYARPESQYVGSLDVLTPLSHLQGVKDKAEAESGFVRPVDALPQDIKRRDEKLAYYKQNLDHIAENINPHEQLRHVKKLAQQYANEMHQGELGTIARNHAARQADVKAVMENKDIDAETKKVLLAKALGDYSGIGDKNEYGAYNSYNATNPAKNVDVFHLADEALKGIMADKGINIDPKTGRALGGQWETVEDSLGRRYYKNKVTKEEVKYDDAYNVALQAVMSNPDVKPYLQQKYLVNTYGKEVPEGYEEQFQRNHIHNPISQAANKHSFISMERDQDLKTDSFPEWYAKRAAGIEEWTPKLTIANSGTATSNVPNLENAVGTLSSLTAQINKIQKDINEGNIDANIGEQQLNQLNSSREAIQKSVDQHVTNFMDTPEGQKYIDKAYEQYKSDFSADFAAKNKYNPNGGQKLTKEEFIQRVYDSDKPDRLLGLIDTYSPFSDPRNREEQSKNMYLYGIKESMFKKIQDKNEKLPVSSSVRVLTGNRDEGKSKTFVDDFSDTLTDQVVNNGTNYTANSNMTTVSDVRAQFPESEGYKIRVSPVADREFGKVVYHMTVTDKNNKQVHAETITPVSQDEARAKQVELGKQLINEAKTLTTSVARNKQHQLGLETMADALFGDNLYNSHINKQIKLNSQGKGLTAPFQFQDEGGNSYSVRVLKEKTPRKEGGYNLRYKLVDAHDPKVVRYDSDNGNGFANLDDMKIELTRDLYPSLLQ